MHRRMKYIILIFPGAQVRVMKIQTYCIWDDFKLSSSKKVPSPFTMSSVRLNSGPIPDHTSLLVMKNGRMILGTVKGARVYRRAPGTYAPQGFFTHMALLKTPTGDVDVSFAIEVVEAGGFKNHQISPLAPRSMAFGWGNADILVAVNGKPIAEFRTTDEGQHPEPSVAYASFGRGPLSPQFSDHLL